MQDDESKEMTQEFQEERIPEGVADVDMTELLLEWQTARTNREHYTIDFPSLDNLVDAVPINHQNKAPYVGDTTIAGLVRSIPRNSLQQLPIFSAVLNGTKKSIRAHFASFLLRKGVFNEDTFGKGLLSTMQLGTEQSITHGYAPFMTSTGMMMDEFGTTMRLMHYAQVDPEPGIQDSNEAGYFYVVANLTKSRVRKIRNAAAKNPNSSWYVEALDRLLEVEPQTEIQYSIYQSDPQKKAQSEYIASTYEFVTKYEVGKGGKFTTFCPQMKESALRGIPNRSKFGFPRVNFLVIDPAALSPFGLSRVRLASPNQNLANIYYQNIASMLLLNSKPPVLKRGRFTKPVQLKQGAVWEALDQNAKAELISMDNGALSQFKPMMEFLSSQIQNIMGVPFSAVNNGGDFSKTGPGVKQQNQVQDLSTNQITNILENFLRQYALVALDTLIAEQTLEKNVDENGEKIPNETTIIVDDECKEAMNRVVPNTVGDDNKFTVDWNDFYDSIETLSVEIELSIGKDELEEKKRADLQDMLVTILQNDDGTDPEMKQKARELMDRLLEEMVPESKRLNPAPATSMPLLPQSNPQGNPQVENSPAPAVAG